MKRLLIRIFDWFIVIAASLIVLFAVLLSLTRVFLPHMTQYQVRIEAWASAAMHQPIHIGHMQAAWSGLQPEFRFYDVEVLDDASKNTLLTVKELDVGINLLKSLFLLRVEPGLLVASGADLTIQQNPEGKIIVNGIMPKTDTPSQINLQDTLQWLFTQNRIYLENINLTWTDKSGRVIVLRNIKARLENSILSHQLVGAAVIEQAIPTAFHFVLNLDGDVLRDKNYNAKFYLKARDLSLPEWMKNQTFYGLKVNSGRGNLELWANWSRQQLQQLQILFKAQQIGLQSQYLTQPLWINHAAGNVIWQRTDNGWNVAGKGMALRLNDKEIPQFKFNLQTTAAHDAQPAMQTLQIDTLNVEQAKSLLLGTTLVSDKDRQLLKGLNPSGELADFTLTYNLHPAIKLQPPHTRGKAKEERTFTIDTGFHHLSWARWGKIPGSRNLSGVVSISPTQGKLTLQSQQKSEFDFGGLFRTVMPIDSLQANIEWQKTAQGWTVNSPNLVLQNQVASMHGNMSLYLPVDQSSPVINILAGFNIVNPQQALRYLPVGIMSKNLVTWLDKAIIDGKETSGSMVLSGPIHAFPFKHQEGRFIIDSDVSDIDLHYRDDWPDIHDVNANLVFDDNSMTITANAGKIFDANLVNAKVTLPDMSHPILQVESVAVGKLNDGLEFLQKSPLNDPIGEALQGFIVEGPMNLNLQLTIPLDKPGVDVLGDIALQNSDIKMPEWWNLEAKNLQGKLQFTEDSLTGNLQGNLLDQPLNLVITTKHPSPKSKVITLDFGKGQMPLKQIEKRFDLPSFAYAQGILNYQAALEIHSGTRAFNVLKINSDLQGIAINLPAPLGKAAQSSVPSQLQIQFGGKQLDLLFNYNKLLSTALTYQRDLENQFKLWSGEVVLGDEQADFQTVPGLLIDGEVQSFSWDEWKPILAPATQKTQQDTIALRAIDVTFGQLNAFGQSLPKITLQLQPLANAWQVGLKNANINGQFIVPKQFPHGTLIGNLQYLYLPKQQPGQNTFSNLAPQEIPALQIKVRDLHFGDKVLGAMDLQTTPTLGGLTINRVRFGSQAQQLSASGSWKGSGATQSSSLSGQLNTDALGSVLKDWQATKNLVGAQGKANFSLEWQGVPYKPDIKTLSGELHMRFNEGRFINLSKDTEAELGIGRVLNLFNLQTIPRRLRLDFSDLTDEGFSFDVMQGDFTLEQGNAYTKNAYVDGPVAKVVIKGRIGLAAQDYDLTMQVSPYVTSSLPVAATVVGGPIAGAVTWLAGKILSPAVSEIITYTYHISGSWNNPTVTKQSEK